MNEREENVRKVVRCSCVRSSLTRSLQRSYTLPSLLAMATIAGYQKSKMQTLSSLRAPAFSFIDSLSPGLGVNACYCLYLDALRGSIGSSIIVQPALKCKHSDIITFGTRCGLSSELASCCGHGRARSWKTS